MNANQGGTTTGAIDGEATTMRTGGQDTGIATTTVGEIGRVPVQGGIAMSGVTDIGIEIRQKGAGVQIGGVMVIETLRGCGNEVANGGAAGMAAAETSDDEAEVLITRKEIAARKGCTAKKGVESEALIPDRERRGAGMLNDRGS
jgi:hypothetical protein